MKKTNKPQKTNLSQNLRLLRDYTKLTREEMAVELDMTADNIYTYEEKNVKPKPLILGRYSDAFGISISTLENELLTERRIKELWNPNLKFNKDGSVGANVPTMNEEVPTYYPTMKKAIADETIAETVIKNHALLRVILRSQAELLAAQRKQPLKKVLADLEEAVNAESSSEFDEL